MLLDLSSCWNPVHPPLYFQLRMIPMPCHYRNHRCSLLPNHQCLLVSFIMGCSLAHFLSKFGFFDVWETTSTGISAMALALPPFFPWGVAESAQESIDGLVTVLSGGTSVNMTIGDYGGAFTSSPAMAWFWLWRGVHIQFTAFIADFWSRSFSWRTKNSKD